MGSQGSKPFPDRVGAFGYNEWATTCGGICNCVTCFAPAWYTKAFCCCGGDGAQFSIDEPQWASQGELRKQFEARLKAPELQELQRSAPKQCGCCASLGNQANIINAKWCGTVNKELLHPAGYTVVARTWITRGGKGEPIEHLCLEIRKGVHGSAEAATPATAADTTESNYVAADVETGVAK